MSSDLTLTIIDTAGIQRYVFGSNNLQHNVGASYLVECATGGWVDDALKALGKYSVAGRNGEIEKDDTVLAEEIYSGGGNTVLLFRTEALAHEFTYALTKKVSQAAPGLQLVITHHQFQWERPLAKAVQDLITKVNDKKAHLMPSMPSLGLGVTADCIYTGAPAVGIEPADVGEEERRISAEAKTKKDNFDGAHERLVAKLSLPDRYTIPRNFDEFGRSTGESSYIAIVHADGNSMGKRVKNIAEAHNDPRKNRAYIRAMHDFSESIRKASEEAIQALINRLHERVDPKTGKIGERIMLFKDGDTFKLPFRPLVMGGDDVTFVCDGRLGLSLAALYLQTMQQKLLSDNNKPLWSRAGVAVVKAHYPFARAYALAKELCQTARARTKEIKGREAYMLDWHFAISGAVRPLEEIRQREYQEGQLLMRPIDVCASASTEWRAWEVFAHQLGQFTEDDWAGKRNKVKALREALRGGQDTVKDFLKAYSLSDLPRITGEALAHEQGYVGKTCAYFDAIEALDFYVPLT